MAEHVLLVLVVFNRDVVARDLGDGALAFGHQHVAGVLRGASLDAGTDVGRFGAHERDGLLLHVGAHRARGWRRRAR